MKISLQLMNKKGQAAAELAILGVLVIMAFSYIMNFGQSLGAQQQNKMESFRRALQKAYARNASVSYTLKKNVSAASVNSGFFQGQGISSEASPSVTWQKGKPGEWKSKDQSSFAFWQINDTAVGDPKYGLPLYKQYTYDATGGRSDEKMLVPVSVLKDNATRTEGYSFSEDKQESNANIAYHKTAVLNDSTDGSLHTQFNTAVDKNPGDDKPKPPTYEDKEVIPYSSSTAYTYTKDWTVAHDLGNE